MVVSWNWPFVRGKHRGILHTHVYTGGKVNNKWNCSEHSYHYNVDHWYRPLVFILTIASSVNNVACTKHTEDVICIDKYSCQYYQCWGISLSNTSWWWHETETFSASLALWHLCREFTGHRWIPRIKASNAELWCFFFICAWINGWVNNREAGALRRIAPIMMSL